MILFIVALAALQPSGDEAAGAGPMATDEVGAVTSAAPAKPVMITDPVWIRRPSAGDLARFYPPRAMTLNARGSAKVRCVLSETGALLDCVILQETPSGMGFGDATVKMAKFMKAKTTNDSGESLVGAYVEFSMNYAM